jgi:protein CpxP
MKKLLVTFIMLGWVMNIYSQHKPHRSPEEKATQVADTLSKQLALSSEQKSKIYTMALEHAKAVRAIKDKKEADRKAAHSEMKTLREGYEKNLKTVLNNEQITKWEQLKAQRKDKHHKGKGRHHEGHDGMY